MISLSVEIYLSLYLNKFEKSAEEKMKRIEIYIYIFFSITWISHL
jgi:hypothetical protein